MSRSHGTTFPVVVARARTHRTENTYSDKLGTTRSFFVYPLRSRRIRCKLIPVPKTEKLAYTTINARKLAYGRDGTGGVLGCNVPIGRAGSRDMHHYDFDRFSKLNLSDSADLSCHTDAGPSASKLFATRLARFQALDSRLRLTTTII